MSTLTAPSARRGADGLAVIGRTLHDLRGIRFDEGEGGGTPPAPPAAPAAPPAAPVAPPAPPAAPAPPAPVTPPAPPVNIQGDPDGYIRSLREESRERRLALEALQGEHQTTTQERDTLRAERDQLAREKAIILNAPELQANAALLLDSASFQRDLASVDPSDTEAVKAAITAALEKNAAFKTGPALPPSSGGGHQGGQPSATPLSLDGAVKKHFGG